MKMTEDEKKPEFWRWTESNWKNPDLKWEVSRRTAAFMLSTAWRPVWIARRCDCVTRANVLRSLPWGVWVTTPRAAMALTALRLFAVLSMVALP